MAEKQDFKTKVKGAFGTKAFKSGGYSLLASVIVIVIVFALNMAVGALPANWTKFDMTDTGMFSLSDQSKELVKSIDEPVTIYVLQSGSNGETVYELALQYRALNSNITVEVRDPVANPGFVQQYTDEQLGYGVIVESARRSATVSSSSLYRTEMATDGSYQYYFHGESLITGALDKVTTDTLPKIYRLVGHGEAELSAALTASIETDNFELEDLSLLSMDSVPEDADCVLIHRPSSDLSEDDAAKLASYLEGRRRRHAVYRISGRRADQPVRPGGRLRPGARRRTRGRAQCELLYLRLSAFPAAGARRARNHLAPEP